ncbi:MAG: lipoyl domain-containing protein [Clostridia bacterium]|nr:lipoyl domain-containing protein [Clostridia bacterium]
MNRNVNMPKLSPEMESGVLCAWLKDEGDAVEVGDALFEIETDKVVNQIEATEAGTLKKQLFEEGDTVPVNAAVAVMETKA